MADHEATGDEARERPDGFTRRAAGGDFGGRSRWADIGGPVHYLDFGGPAQAPVIVAVHGLGGSSVNWAAVAPALTAHYRLIAPDLGGFGLTRAGGRDVSVSGNRALLHRFLQTAPAVGRKPMILMGNSMGGMISLLEAGAAPPGLAALILVDPALPFAFARPDPVVATVLVLNGTPGLGRVLRGLRRNEPPEVRVARLLSLCCADAARVPAAVVAQHVEMERQRTEFRDREQALDDATGSVVYTLSRQRRAYRTIADSVRCPVLLLHGDQDRLVPVTVARAAARAHANWTYTELTGVGHVPQLEVPDETARLVVGWLTKSAFSRHA